MAFPWTFEECFELGTIGAFNSETDTESRLDIVHYSTLARIPGAGAPFRGAYCLRVDLANDGSPADAYVQEDDGFDIALDGTLYVRFYFRITSDLVMANNDEFVLLALQSAGPVNEVVVTVQYSSILGYPRIGIGETAGAQFKDFSFNEWHCMELFVTLDDGVSDDGTIDGWLDGSAFTQVTGLDQAAIAQARLGVTGQDAGTTRGTVLIDQVVTDDARIGPIISRYAETVVLTKSGHVFVGDGVLENVSLRAGAATDCVLAVYDTDTAYTTDEFNKVVEITNTANSATEDPQGVPVHDFKYGCFIQLSGTNPRAIARITPRWLGEGLVRVYGNHRKPHPVMG